MKFLDRFERFYVRFNRLHHIPGSKTHYIYVCTKTYHGKTLVLNDESSIMKGDRVCELHIDNLTANQFPNTMSNIQRDFTSELKLLAEACRNNPEYCSIKGIFCLTILDKILVRNGFTSFPMPENPVTFFIRQWESMLRYRYSVHTQKGKKRALSRCWISSKKLQVLYGAEHYAGGDGE